MENISSKTTGFSEKKEEPEIWIAPGAVVDGDVHLSDGDSIWYNAVIRAEKAPVILAENVNIQDNATLHTDPGFPVEIGEGTTVGHNTIVHGCRIGKNCVIGMGSIILNGAVIEDNCIVGAGALVTEGKVIPEGSLAIGLPAKAVRRLSEAEIEGNRENAKEYLELMEEKLKDRK